MANRDLKITRISDEVDADGDHEYVVGDAGVRVYAPDQRSAERSYFRKTIDRLQSNLDERPATAAALEKVGECLRAGGALLIAPTSRGYAPYIEAANALGYAAETQSIRDQTWLRVATDHKALDAIKGRLDRLYLKGDPEVDEAPLAGTSAIQLSDVGEALFGGIWQTEVATAVGVNDRTVRRWISGYSTIPEGVRAELASMCTRRAKHFSQLAAALLA